MCVSKQELVKDTVGKWKFCTGSYNGTLIIWEMQRMSPTEFKIIQVKDLPLAYGQDPRFALKNSRLLIQSLLYSSLN